MDYLEQNKPFQPAFDEPEPVPEAEAPDTPARLRAFEDRHLGPDHVRPHGLIERGIGSPFAALPDKHKAHHRALEALIAAEKEHQKASSAEAAAHDKLEAAVKRAAETEEVSEREDGAPAPAPAPAASEQEVDVDG